MPFDISEFSSYINSRDFLRTNKHLVRIFPPNGLNLPSIGSEIEFWGETSEIPQFQLGTHTVMRHGYGSKELRPFVPVYGEWQIIFRVDSEGQIWRYFKEWNKAIVANDVQSTSMENGLYEVGYKDDYVADMSLSIYDELGNVAINVTLIEAYPISVGQVRVDWSTQEYMRLPITISFTDFIET